MQVLRTSRHILWACTAAFLLSAGCRKDQPPAESPAPPPVRSLGQVSQELGLGADLTDDQKNLLAARFKDERLGMKPMLQDILDRDREIQDLQNRIAALEAGLPSSVVAQKGDRHEALLQTYLHERGVAEPDAQRLIADVHVQPLVPGYRVWAYLKDGVFGTWVTAGDAPTSPREQEQEAWRKLSGERDVALRDARNLKQQLEAMTRERGELKKQLDVLREDVGGFSDQVEQLKQEARASRQGARYLAGSKKQLRDSGIISGGLFKRVGVQRLERLETLDLNQTNEIVLNSNEHGLAQIKKVKVLPDGFRRDQDYSVDLLKGGQMARVSLLDVDKFKRSTFVVVLE